MCTHVWAVNVREGWNDSTVNERTTAYSLMLYKYGDYLCRHVYTLHRIECWTGRQAGRVSITKKKNPNERLNNISFYSVNFYSPHGFTIRWIPCTKAYNIFRCAFIFFFLKFNAICFIFSSLFRYSLLPFSGSRFRSILSLYMYVCI